MEKAGFFFLITRQDRISSSFYKLASFYKNIRPRNIVIGAAAD
jgi:hypothetical protein